MKTIAVILCGSGFKDGSEIREAVGVLWALSSLKVQVECFAIDEAQFDVVNHVSGETSTRETRNMLIESARIARGKVSPLSTLKLDKIDGLIIPGGFGAAKNLCTFASEGAAGRVHAELNKILHAALAEQKPIGVLCIAPAILALGFKDRRLELTVGARSSAAAEIEKLGHRHVECSAHEIHIDEKHSIISTPAYMYDDAPLHEIFMGIQKLVVEVVKRA